jgi:hypothetical protein
METEARYEVKNLINPVDAISTKNTKTHKEHGSTIKSLIGREGMRVIGKAHDLGIVVKDSE